MIGTGGLTMKFRNKFTGEVLEAFQYDGDMQNSDGEYYVPEWAVEALKTGDLYYADLDAGGMPPLCLKTEEEDDFMIPVGFYVVKKADGTIDAFWEEFFEFVYQPMEEEQ